MCRWYPGCWMLLRGPTRQRGKWNSPRTPARPTCVPLSPLRCLFINSAQCPSDAGTSLLLLLLSLLKNSLSNSPHPGLPLPLSAFSPGPSLAVSVMYRHRFPQCVPRGTVCIHSMFKLESCISNTPQAKSISNPRLKLCVPFSVHGPPPSFREDQAPGALPSFPRGQTGNQTRRTPSSQDLPSPPTPRLPSPVLQRPPHSPTAAAVTSPKYSCGYVTDPLNSLLDSLKATS